jgi:regulator of RNase E activity RraA
MEEKKLTGRIARERITLMQVPQPPDGAVAAYLALGDPTGIVSDAMDELGIPCGVVGAHILKPTMAGTVMVGPALTIRNATQRADALEGARRHVNKMAEFEGHNLATPGDVMVIQGVSGMSNMGGISAQTGKRQGEVGAVVLGGVRDVAHSRAVGYPVWASEFTAVTGKWRLETMEINGPVQVGDVRVEAGDLVVRRHRRLLRSARAHPRRAGAVAEEGESRTDPLLGHRPGRPDPRADPFDLRRERPLTRAGRHQRQIDRGLTIRGRKRCAGD